MEQCNTVKCETRNYSSARTIMDEIYCQSNLVSASDHHRDTTQHDTNSHTVELLWTRTIQFYLCVRIRISRDRCAVKSAVSRTTPDTAATSTKKRKNTNEIRQQLITVLRVTCRCVLLHFQFGETWMWRNASEFWTFKWTSSFRYYRSVTIHWTCKCCTNAKRSS